MQSKCKVWASLMLTGNFLEQVRSTFQEEAGLRKGAAQPPTVGGKLSVTWRDTTCPQKQQHRRVASGMPQVSQWGSAISSDRHWDPSTRLHR